MESKIELYKRRTIQEMEYFLNTFSFVPDDKLTWQATPTAKSPMRIAAHTAWYAGRFAQMIKDPSIMGTSDKQARDAAEAAITSREEMEALFRKGTEAVIAAMDSLTPEQVESTLDSGFGSQMPMVDLLDQPSMHAATHAAQIDLLQTCWGDQEIHF